MNVYDFDGTLLEGDSEIYFFRYIKRNFKLTFKERFNMKYYKLREKYGMSYNITRPKIYSFLKSIDNIDDVVKDFWDKTKIHLYDWFSGFRKDSDIVVSATPRFLLEPIISELGFKTLIATDMDKNTGKLNGVYYLGEEKVKQFSKYYNINDIDEFYSDSFRDTPLAIKAKKAYMIKNGVVTPWEF